MRTAVLLLALAIVAAVAAVTWAAGTLLSGGLVILFILEKATIYP